MPNEFRVAHGADLIVGMVHADEVAWHTRMSAQANNVSVPFVDDGASVRQSPPPRYALQIRLAVAVGTPDHDVLQDRLRQAGEALAHGLSARREAPGGNLLAIDANTACHVFHPGAEHLDQSWIEVTIQKTPILVNVVQKPPVLHRTQKRY